MKKKKAELLPENVASTILAVLGIALLIIGGIYVYQRFNSNEDSEQAKTLVDSLEGKINLFLNSEEERGVVTIQGFNEEWRLHGFDSEDLERPDECFFETCICICPSQGDCGGKDATCRLFEDLEGIDVNNYRGFLGGLDGNTLIIWDYIYLPRSIVEIELIKEGKVLKIDYYEKEYRDAIGEG